MSDHDCRNRLSAEKPIASTTSMMRGLRSAPITDRHLSRLAIVYVRQSNTQQIFDHQESRERQYALADYAALLVSLASKLALNCSCLLCWMERRVLFLDSISRGPCVDEDRMS